MKPEKELNTLSASEYIFLRWLAEHHPKLYADAEERQKSIGGFMDSLTTVFKSVSDAAPAVLEQYVKSQQDLAVLQENLARAKAGALPINNPGVIYAPRVASSPFAQVPVWAWAAMGLGVAYLLMKR